MKKYLLLLLLGFDLIINAQPCVTYEGYGPVLLKYGINVFGQPATTFPVVPLYWNRFYKANEITGQIGPTGCAYPADPNIHELGACACILSDFYFRKVTPSCDPTGCGGDLDLPMLPKTDNNSNSINWSDAATWTGTGVPDIAASMAVMVTKSITIDANLSFGAGHWLLLSNGMVSIQTGKTVTLNSTVQIKAAAQLENFGTLKGEGQIVGSLSNNGTLSPGNSPGKFIITGNYTAGSTAIHQMEIASPNLYDTIVVDQNIAAPGGTAVLNGTLTVSLLNGFTPSTGETYKIMNFGAATGAFTSVNLPVLRPGLSWSLQYNATDVSLIVNGVLPVTFASFNAARKGGGVQTDWTTTAELNVARYQIERSADGTAFAAAGSVNSRGGSSNLYSWYDPAPLNGKNYYRLKAIDLDGTWKHSKTVVVDMQATAGVSAFPNPVKPNGVITINLQNMVAAKVDILNATGQMVYSNVGSSSGIIHIPVPAVWPRGTYVLRVLNEKQWIIKKILVQ